MQTPEDAGHKSDVQRHGLKKARIRFVSNRGLLSGHPSGLSPEPRGNRMYVNANALLSLLAGILILIRPALLNYIIAIYLIIIGVLGMIR